MSRNPDPTDLLHMRRAMALSRCGFPAPNPHVGCVLVRDGEVIGEGYHHFAGGPHAEIDALQKCGFQAQGATAYVTMEPCNGFGRTGPCSEALLKAGIRRVVYSVPDPNPLKSGGAARLAQEGLDVSQGLLEAEARAANEAFLFAFQHDRPFVVGKAAITLDGRIALHGAESITGNQARAAGHRLRAECGAVLIGPGTVIADNPLLTARIPGVKNPPIRIVLDPRGNLSKTARVFNDDAPTWHVVPQGAPCYGERIDLAERGLGGGALLQEFRRRGLTSLLIEGGGRTLGAFIQADLVDRLELFLAPKVFGAGRDWAEFNLESADQAPGFCLEKIRRRGLDLQLTYRPNR